MKQRIENLSKEIQALTASTPAEVEELRIKYLSKKGLIASLFNDFRTVPADQKKEMGQLLNRLKDLATDTINGLRDALSSKDELPAGLDLTRTPSPIPMGTRPLLLPPSRGIVCGQRRQLCRLATDTAVLRPRNVRR